MILVQIELTSLNEGQGLATVVNLKMNWNEYSHELHLTDGDLRRVQFLPRDGQLVQVRWIELI